MKTTLLTSPKVILLASILALLPCQTRAASPSEMLEKGIYTEETKGDVDSAITIYQQLITEAKNSQTLAAQAQFRLGQCYLKKNRNIDATAAFQKLIADFPNEKELIAKAREFLPAEIAVGPVPWVDGERLTFNVALSGGMNLGAMVYRADLVDAGGRKLWRVGAQTAITASQSVSSADADPETFRPVSSRWKHVLLGEATGSYKTNEVTIQKIDGSAPCQLKSDKPLFDNEQVVHMVRRLPLQVGYKTTIPIISTLGTKAVIPLGTEVTARETVEVPAGKFDCFKVQFSIGQTFWFSNDAHRYPVKFEAGGAVVTLVSVTQQKAGQAVPFRDDELGVSFTVPANWVVHRLHGFPAKAERVVLLDPDADADSCDLTLVPIESVPAASRQSSRAWAEADFREHVSNDFKDAKIRPESWKTHQLGGRVGASYIGDFTYLGKPRVAYSLRILGAKTCEQFDLVTTPEKFPELQAAFEKIIASYQKK
jgi:hypothetical protein